MRVLLVVTILLAGCTASDAPEPAPTGQQLDPDPTPMNTTVEAAMPAHVAYSMTACRQLHGVFPARASDFESALPDGFSLVPGQADGAIDLFVYATSCEAGRVLLGQNATADESHGELWVLVAVNPPAEGDARDDYLALGSFVDQTRLEDALLDAGAPIMAAVVTAGDVAWSQAGGAVTWLATSADATHSVRTTTGPPDGTFPATAWRYWLTEDREVAGILELDHGEAEDGGLGAALFEASGDTNAPAAFPGIAHVIHSFNAVGRYSPIESVDWFTTTA